MQGLECLALHRDCPCAYPAQLFCHLLHISNCLIGWRLETMWKTNFMSSPSLISHIISHKAVPLLSNCQAFGFFFVYIKGFRSFHIISSPIALAWVIFLTIVAAIWKTNSKRWHNLIGSGSTKNPYKNNLVKKVLGLATN